jgi:hypothetical protein
LSREATVDALSSNVQDNAIETPDTRSADASALVAACEHAWRAIQRHHPGVPDTIIILGSGVERGRLVKLGHWWGGRWIADGQLRGEVLLAGEALHLHATQVFEVLLHEATHGLNAARGIKDSSRGGRYHNTKFKSTAEELGLQVSLLPPYAWSKTELTFAARERYISEIQQLGDAMRIARRVALTNTATVGGPNTGDPEHGADLNELRRTTPPATVCGCGRRMRMAPRVLKLGPVFCGLCNAPFTSEHMPRATEPPERPAAHPSEPTDAHPLISLFTGNASEVDLRELTDPELDGLDLLRQVVRDGHSFVENGDLRVWYDSWQAGVDTQLLDGPPEEIRDANELARALLKLDGTLTGPALYAGDLELLRGELVMVQPSDEPSRAIDGRHLPPAGCVGEVTQVLDEAGIFQVDFATDGIFLLAASSPAAAALDYAYVELLPEDEYDDAQIDLCTRRAPHRDHRPDVLGPT